MHKDIVQANQEFELVELLSAEHKKVHKIVLGNRNLKLRAGADVLKISDGSVFTILL